MKVLDYITLTNYNKNYMFLYTAINHILSLMNFYSPLTNKTHNVNSKTHTLFTQIFLITLRSHSWKASGLPRLCTTNSQRLPCRWKWVNISYNYFICLSIVRSQTWPGQSQFTGSIFWMRRY